MQENCGSWEVEWEVEGDETEVAEACAQKMRRVCGKEGTKVGVGIRRRERPRKRWKECIKENPESCRLKEDAMDRLKWCHRIRSGYPT